MVVEVSLWVLEMVLGRMRTRVRLGNLRNCSWHAVNHVDRLFGDFRMSCCFRLKNVRLRYLRTIHKGLLVGAQKKMALDAQNGG